MAKPGPSTIDAHVGRMIRQRRKSLGMTQSQLADALKLTFQQVQKYERGVNRVSIGVLVTIAGKLDTDLDFFVRDFVELKAGAASPDLAAALEWMRSEQAMSMAYDMALMDDAHRTAVVTLAAQLAAAQQPVKVSLRKIKAAGETMKAFGQAAREAGFHG